MTMLSKTTIVTLGALTLAGLSGCASSGSGQRSPTSGIAGAYVPAGEFLRVKLDRELRSFDSGRQNFTATVQSPLVDSHGYMVIPAGAKVHGQALSIEANGERVLRIELNDVETTNGRTAKLDARVLSAGNYKLSRPEQLTPGGYATIHPKPYAADGRAAPYHGFYIGNQREVRLGQGTTLRLELTSPIILR
jgi:hypothetical protein